MKTYHLFIRDSAGADTVILAMRDRDESTHEYRRRARLVKAGGFVAEVVDGEIAGLNSARTNAEFDAIKQLWAEKRPDWLKTEAAAAA